MQKRPSVLIITPRRDIRTMLEMTLSFEGLQVFSASNVNSALLQLRVIQPDLIIADLNHSIEQEVVQIRALSTAPVLALGDGATLNGAAVAASLPYPINVDQLCSKVAGLIDMP